MNAIMPQDYTTMTAFELAKFTKQQEIKYKQLRDTDTDGWMDEEEIYIDARKLFFGKLKKKKREASSEDVDDLLQEKDEEFSKRELPIGKLNQLLTNQKETELNLDGGVVDSGFLAQLIGQSGAGKSTLALSIYVGLSNYVKVSWLDYERGRTDFKRELRMVLARTKNKYNTKNMRYLDGFSASDELEFIAEEITLLAYTGVRQFILDSFMAIMINGENDSASWAKAVALRLQSLAKELNVGIWVINQVNAKDEEAGRRQPAWGLASRYASDYMFFIQKMPKLDEGGRPIKDDVGQPVYDGKKRLFTCDKNRYDYSYGEGSVEITEADIYGELDYEVVEYDMNSGSDNVYMPQV